MDRKMDTWTIVIGIFTIIGVVVTIALLMKGSIDKKIEEKIRDPNFVKQLADEVRLPFVIFDENNKILADYGAYQYLNRIDVLRNEKKQLTAIRITPVIERSTPQISEKKRSFGHTKSLSQFPKIECQAWVRENCFRNSTKSVNPFRV